MLKCVGVLGKDEKTPRDDLTPAKLNLIRILYNDEGQHRGEWHADCSQFTGGSNCGYVGEASEHWTCCLDTVFDASCSQSHVGFFH